MNKPKRVSYAKYGYLFSLPFVIAFTLCMLYPVVYTAVIGFTNLKGAVPPAVIEILEDPWQNFKDIANSDIFRIALTNTFKIWVVNFIPQILLALLLAAWFTDTQHKVRGQGFFKVIFYLPNIITAATVAILFNALIGYPKGPINSILTGIGLTDEPYYFALDKTAAWLIVAFIQFWQWYGNTMIVLVSGILGINPELFEAAEIDGAGGWQKFFFITIPNLKTILLYSLITSLVGGLTMFDIPKLFLNNGPDNATLTASVFIYNQAFSGSYMYNRAAAASMILFIIIAICAALLFFVMRDKDEIAQHKIEVAQTKAFKKQLKAQTKAYLDQLNEGAKEATK